MKRLLSIMSYSSLAFFIMVIDVLTKQWALSHCQNPRVLHNFITCELSFNRGIAWSLLNFDNNHAYFIITLLIVAVLLMLSFHMGQRWHARKMILGEVMVIAGAAANLIDRVLYESVIDFILLHYESFAFPALFNVADIFITVGTIIMLLEYYYE